jgi:hypothetical protein
MSYRLATIEDAKTMTMQRNLVNECFFYSGEITDASTARFLVEQETSRDSYMFLSFLGEVPLGQFSIYNIKDNMAEFGRLIRYRPRLNPRAGCVEENARKSFEIDCVRAIYDLAVLHGLDHIYAWTWAWNKRALLFFGRLGFHVKPGLQGEAVCLVRSMR